MKNFVLPGFYEKFSINKRFVLLYEIHPEYFIDDFQFGCFYGNFGFNIWSGGRIFTSYKTVSVEELREIRDFYNDRNIPIRLTFTNALITEEHLQDNLCNIIMEVLHNGKNEVVTASSVLERYLRSTYPNFKYCSSTTKCILNIDQFKEELHKDYYQVCLDYNLNHNKELLSSLNPDERFKCEFLCNAICPPGCKHRKEHYRLNSLFSLNGGKYYSVNCGINGSTLHPRVMSYHNNISPKDIQEYSQEGFSHFKLEGRSLSDVEVVLNLTRYCIKEEYQQEATLLLLTE